MLENALEMLFANSYYNLAINLEMKQYSTSWRGLLQNFRQSILAALLS
jgi:hypothetical protein